MDSKKITLRNAATLNTLKYFMYQPDYKYIPPVTWNFLTPFYDFFCWITGLGPKFKQKILNSVEIRSGDKIADIACGTGVFLKIAKRKYPHANFIGLDPDEKALSIAKNRLEKVGLQVDLQKAFAEALPLETESVNVCFTTLALHHMPDRIKKKAIEEMHRILKKGGKIVVTDFGKSNSAVLRKLLSWENIEYLEGNLRGLIEEFMHQAGFKNIQKTGKKFPGIYTFIGEKI